MPLFLGMLVSLADNYEVKSNKESGYGRYAHIKKCGGTTKNLGVMIIPKDITKIGIIIEFKKINEFLDDTIEDIMDTFDTLRGDVFFDILNDESEKISYHL